MAIRPSALLRSWRGRRLLLEFALGPEHFLTDRRGAEQPLARAVMSAAFRLDPDRGRSVALLGVQEAVPTATPESVASLLDRVHLAEAEPSLMLRALADVVANARYWQEPDGEDLLAATPAVRAALGRVALHVAVSADAVGWWSEPLARGDQHAIAWDGGPTGAPTGEGAGAAEQLAQWRSDVLEEERRAREVTPTDPTASWSGAWWSIPASDLTHTTRGLGPFGPAGLWLVEDGMGWQRAVTHRVEVPGDARVFEIDSAGAWATLCREYPLEVTAQKRHDWYRATGRAGRWVIPDWSKVAVDHDAVHLTVAAYLAAAGTTIQVDHDTGSVIAGWNPDETYWLADTVRPERAVAGWVLDDADWVRGF